MPPETTAQSIAQLDPRQRQLLFERIRAKRSAAPLRSVKAPVPTQSPLETRLHQQLGEIWQGLLRQTRIAPNQSFFELGGHSLQITELKFRIHQQLKIDIPVAVLYELSTIAQLSAFIIATHGHELTADAPQEAAISAAAEDEEEGTL